MSVINEADIYAMSASDETFRSKLMATFHEYESAYTAANAAKDNDPAALATTLWLESSDDDNVRQYNDNSERIAAAKLALADLIAKTEALAASGRAAFIETARKQLPDPKDANKALRDAADRLTTFADVVGYSLPDGVTVPRTVGGGNVSAGTGDGLPKWRLSRATVDGNDVAATGKFVTLTDVARVVGTTHDLRPEIIEANGNDRDLSVAGSGPFEINGHTVYLYARSK